MPLVLVAILAGALISGRERSAGESIADGTFDIMSIMGATEHQPAGTALRQGDLDLVPLPAVAEQTGHQQEDLAGLRWQLQRLRDIEAETTGASGSHRHRNGERGVATAGEYVANRTFRCRQRPARSRCAAAGIG